MQTLLEISLRNSWVAPALWLTLSLAHLGYAHPFAHAYTETISTGFFTSKDVTRYHYLFLGRQLTFGLIWGTATALVGVVVAFFLKPPYGMYISHRSTQPKKSRYLSVANLVWTALGIGGISLFSWLVAASSTPMNDWGFSFDLGANMAWLGLGLGCVLGIGVGASLPIWWTAIRQWVQGRR